MKRAPFNGRAQSISSGRLRDSQCGYQPSIWLELTEGGPRDAFRPGQVWCVSGCALQGHHPGIEGYAAIPPLQGAQGMLGLGLGLEMKGEEPEGH